MSSSVPTTTITPQPITKLPKSSDQRTCARRASLIAAGVGARRLRPAARARAQCRTLSASGLTMFVGWPSMKLTTFSKAARK